jgi:hypothetical protein
VLVTRLFDLMSQVDDALAVGGEGFEDLVAEAVHPLSMNRRDD